MKSAGAPSRLASKAEMKTKAQCGIQLLASLVMTCLLVASQGFGQQGPITGETTSPDIIVEVSVDDESKSALASTIVQQGRAIGFVEHKPHDFSHYYNREVLYVVLEHQLGSLIAFTDLPDSNFIQIAFYEFEAMEDGKEVLSAFVTEILSAWPDKAYIIQNKLRLPI